MPPQRILHFTAALVLAVVSAVGTYQGAGAASTGAVAAHHQAGAPLLTRPVSASTPAVKREVFGFALASSLSDPTVGYPSWKFSLLSTVAFFGLHVNWDGTIVKDSGWTVWNSSALTGLLSAAHASGTKVVVTIDLQDFQPGTPNMCAGLINRSTTVSQAVAQVAAKGVDGVNVDYEGLNGTCQNGQTSRSMVTAFVQQLRAALPAGSALSVDTYASSAADPLGFFDVAGLNPYVDSFFVMAYDLEYSNWRHAPPGCSRFCLGPTAPLSGYYYNDTSTVAQYMGAVPANKIILGVPYYGRKACVAGAGPNQYPATGVVADSYLDASGEATATGVQPGSFAMHRDAIDPNGMEQWDTWTNTTLGCTRELYWDDIASLGKKYDLVNQEGIRGVGIWTLNYGGGASELWAALQNRFAGCSSVSASAKPASPALGGTNVSVTATGVCAAADPLYEFWIQSPGASSYTLAQAYATNPIFNWNTSGIAPGTYRINVWVRAAGSPGAFGNASGRWDTYNAGLTFAVTSKPCSAVTVLAAPAAAVMAGMPVKLTASAAGCANPMYEFWLMAPGATLYKLAQAFSTSAVFDWSTAGLALGPYRVNVWVHDATSWGTSGNSYGRWDAYNATQVISLAAGCPSVAESASPASAAAGLPVTVTAGASGCASPLYEFWVLAPGATLYTLAQSYSTNPALSWKTSALPAGKYRITVWVRAGGTAGVYGNSYGRWDAYNASLIFTITPSCKSVTDVASPASPKVGTTVTVTATASGCPNPLYEFWVLAPGASLYTLARPYSTNKVFGWATGGLARGTYRITVWVRDASSSGVASNPYGSWDTYNAGLLLTLG